MSGTESIPYMSLSFHTKLKAELQAIADAMCLSLPKPTVVLLCKEIKEIQTRMHVHPELADNPQFLPLFAHRTAPNVAGYVAAAGGTMKNSVKYIGSQLEQEPGSGCDSLAYTVAYFVLRTGSANIFIVRTLLSASRLEAVASNCLKWFIVNIFLFLFPGFAGLLAILSSGNRLRIHRHASPNSIAYTLAYFATFPGSVAVFIASRVSPLFFRYHLIRICKKSKIQTSGSCFTIFVIGFRSRSLPVDSENPGPSRPARRADRSRMANPIAQDLLNSDSETAPNEKKCKRKSGMKSKQNRDNSDPEDQDFTSGASGDGSDSDIEMIIPNEDLADSLPRKTIPENAKRQTAAKPTGKHTGPSAPPPGSEGGTADTRSRTPPPKQLSGATHLPLGVFLVVAPVKSLTKLCITSLRSEGNGAGLPPKPKVNSGQKCYMWPEFLL
ncbi:hypothetical protein B0H13DRAFT_1873539 [Mycena leptocephala]|nr:hypothetical protein B0H13DRAFT_1873539 [Mycena leptocephala]